MPEELALKIINGLEHNCVDVFFYDISLITSQSQPEKSFENRGLIKPKEETEIKNYSNKTLAILILGHPDKQNGAFNSMIAYPTGWAVKVRRKCRCPLFEIFSLFNPKPKEIPNTEYSRIDIPSNKLFKWWIIITIPGLLKEGESHNVTIGDPQGRLEIETFIKYCCA